MSLLLTVVVVAAAPLRCLTYMYNIPPSFEAVCTARGVGLQSCVATLLLAVAMPPSAMSVVTMPQAWVALMAACVVMDTPLVGTSLFDGCGSLSTAFQETFGAAGSVEILNDPEGQDILKAAGVKRYLTLLKSTVVDGVHCFGPPCCSWGFLTKVKSMRSPSNVLGARFDPWVAMHNRIASFVAMAITACTACGVWFMVENPKGSLIFEHPAMKAALQTVGARKVMISLRSFGHSSEKPLWLYGTAPWLEELEGLSARLRTAALGRPREQLAYNVDGSVTGNSDALSESAAYPADFSRAIASLHHDFMQRLKRVAEPQTSIEKRRRVADADIEDDV